MRALDEDLQSGITVGFVNQPLIVTVLLRLWTGLRLYDLLVKGVSRLEWVYKDMESTPGLTMRAHGVPSSCLCTPRWALPLLNKISGSSLYHPMLWTRLLTWHACTITWSFCWMTPEMQESGPERNQHPPCVYPHLYHKSTWLSAAQIFRI